MSDLPKIEELLEAGAHLGHLRAKWNPKMGPYIFCVRNDTHIINLEKTLEKLVKAIKFIKDLIKDQKIILFVGTKVQAKDAIRKAAESLNMPYVNFRWLGGTLTNFDTIQSALSRFEELEKEKDDKGFMNSMTKKEQKNFLVNLEKMEKSFRGIKTMKKLPDAVLVVDTVEEKVAVKEANSLNIPIIAIVDSNSDPSKIDYPIPANDDSKKAIELILDCIVRAYKKTEVAKKEDKAKESDTKKAAPATPEQVRLAMAGEEKKK